MKDTFNNVNIQSKQRAPKTKTAQCSLHKSNILIVMLIVFVAVAAMQAFKLGNMLSEAKSISNDIDGIREEQEILLEQYSLYNNNLSYYLNSCQHKL